MAINGIMSPNKGQDIEVVSGKMEDNTDILLIMNPRTGEIVGKLDSDKGNVTPLPDTEETKKIVKRIDIRKRGRGRFLSDEQIDNLTLYPFKGQKYGYSFVFNQEIRELLPELSSPASKVFLLFLSWLHMDGYCYPGNRIKMVTQEQIAEAAGMQRRYVAQGLEELLEKEIVCALRDSYSWRYLMNPFIAGKGKGYDREQAEYFEEYAEERGIELPR